MCICYLQPDNRPSRQTSKGKDPFLPRNAALAWYMYVNCCALSVGPSITSRQNSGSSKQRHTLATYLSFLTLGLKICGHCQQGRRMQVGWVDLPPIAVCTCALHNLIITELGSQVQTSTATIADTAPLYLVLFRSDEIRWSWTMFKDLCGHASRILFFGNVQY